MGLRQPCVRPLSLSCVPPLWQPVSPQHRRYIFYLEIRVNHANVLMWMIKKSQPLTASSLLTTSPLVRKVGQWLDGWIRWSEWPFPTFMIVWLSQWAYTAFGGDFISSGLILTFCRVSFPTFQREISRLCPGGMGSILLSREKMNRGFAWKEKLQHDGDIASNVKLALNFNWDHL